MSKVQFDLVIVGVGGQGTLLASRVLGRLAMAENLGVKVSEVHGMSQRGGSVITYVRVGDRVHSPMVALGQADYLLSFEVLEAARAAEYLKPEGVAIVNDQRILPMPVITGAVPYPADPLQALNGRQVEKIDALKLALEAGNQKAVNTVLLGVLSKRLPFAEEAWHKAIAACVPRKLLSVNLSAFQKGREQA